MQEIKKRRIVIASVLKPVDDTRMTEKIGSTLAEKFEVHVIGFPSESASIVPGITCHTLSDVPFNRLSVKRLTAELRFMAKAWKLRPDDVIICTHELLFAGWILKILTGCKLIYDVQENYFRNILYTTAFPWVLRPFVATYVRVKEWLFSFSVNHFILAESSYANELNFLRNSFTILENKYKGILHVRPSRVWGNQEFIQLLFSGTLAETTGVFIAIDIAAKLHQVDSRIRLRIVGYAARKEELNAIVSAISDKDYISLVGGSELVPHERIVEEIRNADFGIVSYPKNTSTTGSMPTKLFEYLANTLPMILVNRPEWVDLCGRYDASIPFEIGSIDPVRLHRQMTTSVFYSSSPSGVTWQTESPRLFSLF